MNLDRKIARLKQLNRETFLSDEEIEEREMLKEELSIITQNANTEPESHPIAIKLEKVETKKQRERGPIGKLIVKAFEHFKEKPVTMQELDELKKKAVKFRLKADIEKSKAAMRKAKQNRFGSSSSRPQRNTSHISYDNIERSVSDILGKSSRISHSRNDKDIRKAFYG